MKSYSIKNLDCAQCAINLESNLKKRKDVKDVSINFAASTLTIETENFSEISTYIKKIEPGVEISDIDSMEDTKKLSGRIIFLSILSGFYVIGIIFQDFLHNQYNEIPEYVFFITLYLIAGWRVLFTAAKKIIKGNIFDENFLMSVATIAAIAIHAIPEAIGVMIFYKIGGFFEELAINKSRKSIKALLSIRPDYANLLKGDSFERVKPDMVNIGELILVKPGERIPLDGVVISGSSHIDASALTGESLPAQVGENDPVLSGTIVTTGSLTVRVEKIFKNSSVSRILDLVENAARKKAKTEKFITSFAKIYTPIIVVLAVSIAFVPPFLLNAGTFSEWLYRACVILVISCPCALVISIPLSYFGGIGAASRRGILIKGSNYIDILAKTDTVVFDKTGTLTQGVFAVSEIVTRNGFSKDDLLEYAAYAEAHSNHPIALAIVNAFKKQIDFKKIREHQETAGYGVHVNVFDHDIVIGNDRFLHDLNIEHEDCHINKTVAYVVVDKKYAGYIIIQDEEKKDAAEAVSLLKQMGIKRTIMLTGDNRDIAESMSKTLGIDEYYAGLLPEDKVNALEKIMAGTKGMVAFAGDGINDAPVIAQADVGFAMGKLGSDAAIETADVVLMTDAPSKIPEAIRIAKKTRNILFQNIIFALAVKIIFVAFGTAGLAGMWEAVFADVGVTLLAILNSLRILRLERLIK